ncbi:DNA-binding transcriptional regulator, AcrR family [Monaibacterium marinum]|uniref:DNA-binding transcriptional regulator, AcrR family n=1 Tax=Pontivivens marinum TaxID=1690039 RepID=A0A2C9CSA2_9RHOB|nr:TetR/AcrR family transcriptional regulator [Monaibacterium marinum]SOH94137.1 DNA-binding transcriptional regulator, AcrR family [Monaibacterium marinum]
MTSTQERHAALRERLIDAAQVQITDAGLSAIKARTLATQVGCSVGAIYTVFPDLHTLILAVNGRTFSAMGVEISAAVAAVQDGTPPERLIAMARTYLSFAIANPRRWKALFDIEMSVDSGVPSWYVAAVGQLFELISTPLRDLSPDASEQRIDMMTRGLFSSIHGIVLLGVENRISAVPREGLEEMISFIIHAASDVTSA